MPFNGSGTFSRLYSWVIDAANNVNISSTRTDAEMNGFAAGLTNCVTRDGQSPPSADLPMGGKKLVNLAAATVGTDALNRDTADARYLTTTVGDARYLTAASPVVTGTTLWINTNKLLVQHDGTNGFIRSQIGNLNLGAGGATSLILDAAGGVTANGAMNVVGALSHNGSTVWDAVNLTSSALNSIYGYTPVNPTALASYALLASPTLTGTPAAPTAAVGTSTTQLATTAYVMAAKAPAGQTIASAATVTPTFSDDFVEITAQAAGLTLANPTGTAVNMWGIAIRIKDNGSPQTIAFGTNYRGVGVTLPTTTVAGKTTVLGMIFNNGLTKWDVVSVAQE